MKVLLATCAALLCALPANAYVYTFTVSGTIVSQNGPGTDPNLSVGDKLTVTARVDSQYVLKWGGYGYSVAGTYYENNLTVKTGGLTWITTDDINDGAPIGNVEDDYYDADGNLVYYSYTPISDPSFIFSGHKVSGLSGTLAPSNGSRPELDLGSFSGTANVYRDHNADGTLTTAAATFGPGSSSNNFVIQSNFFSNAGYPVYETPGFTGVWDFAGSTVTVPEPATWALMIVGFGLTGTALRRRSETGNRLAMVTTWPPIRPDQNAGRGSENGDDWALTGTGPHNLA